jgi:hypothetical protein
MIYLQNIRSSMAVLAVCAMLSAVPMRSMQLPSNDTMKKVAIGAGVGVVIGATGMWCYYRFGPPARAMLEKNNNIKAMTLAKNNTAMQHFIAKATGKDEDSSMWTKDDWDRETLKLEICRVDCKYYDEHLDGLHINNIDPQLTPRRQRMAKFTLIKDWYIGQTKATPAKNIQAKRQRSASLGDKNNGVKDGGPSRRTPVNVNDQEPTRQEVIKGGRGRGNGGHRRNTETPTSVSPSTCSSKFVADRADVNDGLRGGQQGAATTDVLKDEKK